MASDLHHSKESKAASTKTMSLPTALNLASRKPREIDSENYHAALLRDHNHKRTWSRQSLEGGGSEKKVEEMEANIYLPSNTKQANSTVAPFLAQHIPEQYNPLGHDDAPEPTVRSNSSHSKYCYRHRPDLKCRRQADELTMDELQNNLGSLSQSDQQGIAHVWSLFSAAPSRHRHLMLQGILTQCCFPQLSFLSASVRDLIKIDFLSALPPELSFKILSYLDTTSLCKAAQVSQRWRSLADDDVVWHKMCEQHIDRKCEKCGWGLPLLEQKRLQSEKRRIQLRAAGKSVDDRSPRLAVIDNVSELERTPSRETSVSPSISSPLTGTKRPPANGLPTPEPSVKRACIQSVQDPNETYFQPRLTRPWKDVYKDRFKVGTNWKHGRCSMKVLKGHTNGIMCLQIDDNILATGSYDTTIKIWDIETGQEIRTLRGHTAGIRCLQFDETRLFSGSMDKTLKVWNWRTGECMKTFLGPTSGIVSLHFSETVLACGSMDHTIKVWDLENKQVFHLRGHMDWVNSVKIDMASRTLFSASDDCTVRLWDIDTRECIKIFKGHVGQVQQVLPLPRDFEVDEEELERKLGLAESVFDTDARTPDLESVSRPAVQHGPGLMGGTPAGNKASPPVYMLTGSLDNTIRLWHVPTRRTIRTFFGHVEGVWALAVDSLRVVSGAEDKMVKVWDPRSGACERTFTGHTGPVTCVGLSDCRLVSGSEDSEVRVYSFGSADEADGDGTMSFRGEALSDGGGGSTPGSGV